MTIDAFRQTLANSMLEMHFIRSDIRSMLSKGNAVDEETHAEFEAAIAQSVDELRPHVIDSDLPDIEKKWEENNVEMILDFEDRTTVRRNAGSKNNYGICDNSEVREIDRIEIRHLLDVSHLLDHICKQVGLLPETKRSERTSGRFT